MWEHGSIKDGKPCEPKIWNGKQLSGTICRICGKHILPDDECYLIISNAFEEARKLKVTNFPVHCDCWKSFSDGITDNAVLALKIKKHRTPKPVFTDEHYKKINAFFDAGMDVGFLGNRNKVYKGGIVRIQKSGSSDILEYCPVTDKLTYRNSRKKRLFDAFFEQELLGHFRNRMNEKLGFEKQPVKTATKEICKIFKKTDEFFNGGKL